MSDINEVPAFAAQQAQQPDGVGAYLVGKSVRLKHWSESNADEKLAALRDHIEVLTHRLQDAETLLQRLRFHQHSPSGELVVYLERIGNRIEPYELRLPTGLRG